MTHISARDKVADETGIPIHEHDGQRRIVEMKKGKLIWQIDIPETTSDDHARKIAEAMSEDNGGGWKFHRVKDRFDHEGPDE